MNTLKQTKTTIAALVACVVFFGMIVARFIYSIKPTIALAELPNANAKKRGWLARAKQWLPRKLHPAPDVAAR
jgi:hypothetical protein